MKTSSRSLILLIHSLSREEKNYILRTAIHYRKGGKNILVMLFKALEKSSTEKYHEAELRKKIPNLAVRKKELFETILNSLADREKKQTFAMMFGKIRHAAMLHYRKFYSEALAILTEVETWADKEQSLYIKGVILQYKTLFANSGLLNNHSFDFEEIANRMMVNAKLILINAEIYQHYTEISNICQKNILLRSIEENEKIKTFIQSDEYEKDVSRLSISTQSFFHFSRAMSFKLRAEYKNAWLTCEKGWKLVEKNIDYFTIRRTQEYLTLSVAYLNACIDARQWRDVEKSLPGFKTFVNEKFTTNIIAAGKLHTIELAYYWYRWGAEITPEIILRIEKFYIQQKHLLGADVNQCLEYLFMIFFFDTNDLSKAWDYCRMILNKKSNTPHKELYDMGRMIFLLILFESNKFSELEHQYEQLYNSIRKKKKGEYTLENLLIRHFQWLIKHNFKKSEVITQWKLLKQELSILLQSDNASVKQLLHLYNFSGWSERKIKELL